MPRGEFSVRSALSAQVDARGFSGEDLFTRGGTTVTSPTYTGAGEGIFPDVPEFLNGNGMPAARTLAEVIESAFSTGGSPSPVVKVEIQADDKLLIAAQEAFSIEAGSGVELGVAVAGQAAVYDGSLWYELFASNDWDRGLIADIDIKFTTAFSTFTIYTGFVQDLPTFVRVSTNAESLTDLDVSGYGWLLDEDGYVYSTRRGGTVALTWDSDDLRLLLGFTGSETPVTGASGSSTYIKATYPCGLFIVPSRPVVKQTLAVAQTGDSARLIGGGHVAVVTGSYLRHILEWYLDGPADCIDLHQHWLRYVLPALSAGMPLTLYQDWGDPRDAALEAEDGVYSDDTTIELGGYRGAVRGYVFDNSGALQANWEKTLRRRAPMTIVLEEG